MAAVESFVCLYCDQVKGSEERSLEHAIPQFLGGDYVDGRFHLKNACKTCNNNLGLWVDAAYGKAWLVSQALAQAASLLYDPSNDPGLPLRCMGRLTLPGLTVPSGQVAEHWIGPSGETVVWMRPHDERMTAYTGGNPIDTRRKPSTMFVFPTTDDPECWAMGKRSVRRAAKGRNKLRLVLCAKLLDQDGHDMLPQEQGFEPAHGIDQGAIRAIRAALRGTLPLQVPISVDFDRRFMCKMALAIGFSVFGEAYLAQQSAVEARNGLWPKKGALSLLRGSSTLHFGKVPIARFASYPGAVALTLMQIEGSWFLAFSINEGLPFVVEIGPGSLTTDLVREGDGYSLLLFDYLKMSVALDLSELLAHRIDEVKHPVLTDIDQRLDVAARTQVKLVNRAKKPLTTLTTVQGKK
ncbi:HNH endonuclease [Xanthomonas campestris pv. campestris]|uniref:HNH endonuclease n=1 Tax=Xanthomonas campestris TaxID=339 RepID=UPI002269E502|nr:HNH endonuclease [Xanthomonas campestris]MEB1347823.1 HNH endonuclease [Xanthomonas campestris pv. campestris]